jgi:heat shock protein HslJ
MTDDRMDARLRGAGADWRAATDAHPDAADVEILDTGVPIRPSRPSRRTALIAAAAAVAAAVVAGGSVLLSGGGGHNSPSADSAGLQGTVWRLVGYGEGHRGPNSLATLFIGKDGKLVADDECSVIGAATSISGDQFGLTGRIEVRSRACVDSSSSVFAGTGVRVLTGPATFSVHGEELTLRAAGEPTMYLVAAPLLPPPTLDVPTFVGAQWLLSAVTDAKGVPQLVPRGATLRIADGRLTASDGCNTLSAAVQVTRADAQLKNASTTQRQCSGSTATTAAVIDRFFTGRGLHGDVAGSTLNVKGDGVGDLTYEWVPADPAAVAPTALTDREWVLTSIAGVAARALASLGVDARGPTSGTDGCTDIDATADVRPGALTLTGIPTAPPTVCTGAAADQATTIDSILNQKPASWSVRGGKLIIYGGGAQAFSLVYETGKPPPDFSSGSPDPSVLTGRTWRLTSIETSGPDTSSSEGSSGYAMRLTFSGTTFTVQERCNDEGGSAVRHPASIDFSGRHIVNAHSCPPPPDASQRAAEEHQVAAVDDVLTGTAKWTIDNNELRLTKGATTLVFGA